MHHFSPAFVDRFHKAMNDLQPVSAESIALFLEQFDMVEYKRGDILLREGEVCRHLYYIIKGGIRCYMHDEHGREINLHFYFEDEFASEFKSLRMQEPSERNLVCMTACKVMRSFRPDYLPLFSQHMEFTQVAFQFFVQLFLQEEAHSEMLQKLSAEERYLQVVKLYPHLLQRVSLTQLASWLGTSRESLSRIRARLNN
ncbi:MAG: Crp/Fnr family transcriptional regulator [Chitinophagaceae bacterium]|nr:Crp/Fnr family transcriptional regulator [Chitinophagaceae bacterium]